MSEEKKPKKKSSASPKEHKEPWQAKYATPAEIQQMVSRRVLLRYNEVRHRTEVHWLSQGPVIREDEQGLLTIFGGDGERKKAIGSIFMPAKERQKSELTKSSPHKLSDMFQTFTFGKHFLVFFHVIATSLQENA